MTEAVGSLADNGCRLKAMKATEKMVRDAVAKSSLIRISADQSAIAPFELPFDQDDTSQGARS